MEGTTPELEAAILQWLNTFSLSRKVEKWAHLADGHILWEILREIDPHYFDGLLPEQGTNLDYWIPKWQNLKHIERQTTTFIRDQCGRLQVLSFRMTPNLQAIAKENAAAETVKLVKIVLYAAVYSPHSKETQAEVIQAQLGPKFGIPLISVLEALEEADKSLSKERSERDAGSEYENTDSESPSRVGSKDPGLRIRRDPELEREEDLIKANAENKKLGDMINKLKSELDQVHDRVRQLEEEKAEAESEFNPKGQRIVDNETFEQLEARSNKDRDVIAQLESDLEAAQTSFHSQNRELERLRGDAGSKEQLRDELQIVKAERDDAVQKAKTNENLKKKINALQEKERSYEKISRENQNFKEQSERIEKLEAKAATFEKAHQESINTISNCEQKIFDQDAQRKVLEFQVKDLNQHLDQTRERHQQDQEYIHELEEKLKAVETIRPDSPKLSKSVHLDDELREEDESELSPEMSMTRSFVDDADTVMLRQRVQVLQSRCNRMEERYLEVQQDNLGLQSALKKQLEGVEASHPFVQQRLKLQSTIDELEKLKSSHFDVEREAAELRDELSKVQAGEKLDSASEAEYKMLRENHKKALADNAALLVRSKTLENDAEDRKDLLLRLLSRRNGEVDEEFKDTDSYKITREQLEIVTKAVPEEVSQVCDNIAGDIAARYEMQKSKLLDLEQRETDRDFTIEKLNQDIDRLQREGTGKASEETLQELANLQRENRLITTAWYDLTTRLQSNTVVLQRRSEPPKGWLGRQRIAVKGVGNVLRR